MTPSKAKTTIVIDENLLAQFRSMVVSRHGSSRALSAELQEAVRAFCPPEIIRLLAMKLGIEIDRYPSLEEVVRNRPKIRGSAAIVVRQMRDGRKHRLLRHK